MLSRDGGSLLIHRSTLLRLDQGEQPTRDGAVTRTSTKTIPTRVMVHRTLEEEEEEEDAERVELSAISIATTRTAVKATEVALVG